MLASLNYKNFNVFISKVYKTKANTQNNYYGGIAWLSEPKQN